MANSTLQQPTALTLVGYASGSNTTVTFQLETTSTYLATAIRNNTSSDSPNGLYFIHTSGNGTSPAQVSAIVSSSYISSFTVSAAGLASITLNGSYVSVRFYKFLQ